MGGQKGVALFNQYLADQLSLTCLSVKENKPSLAKNYELLNTISNCKLRYINPLLFFKVKKIVKLKGITHLIIEHPYWGWLGLLLKWFCHIKLIVHSHNIESLRFKSTGKWWWKILWHYEKIVHRNADINFFIHDDDKNYALKKFKLSVAKSHTITYGIEINKKPTSNEKEQARKAVELKHEIQSHEKLLLFNGTLHYPPNLEAINSILDKINPLLLKSGYQYKIIICGKGLPEEYNNMENYKAANIIYAGFVDDISVYFKAADIFLNPVIEGGGIKTKVVEALGYNLNAVTTESGAIGIPTTITDNKLLVTTDNDWESFAQKIIYCDLSTSIPDEFYEHFYWGNIIKKVISVLYKSIH